VQVTPLAERPTAFSRSRDTPAAFSFSRAKARALAFADRQRNCGRVTIPFRSQRPSLLALCATTAGDRSHRLGIKRQRAFVIVLRSVPRVLAITSMRVELSAGTSAGTRTGHHDLRQSQRQTPP